jgi:hypothetical protein
MEKINVSCIANPGMWLNPLIKHCCLSTPSCENVKGSIIDGNKIQAVIPLAKISIPAAYENALANDIFLLCISSPFDIFVCLFFRQLVICSNMTT